MREAAFFLTEFFIPIIKTFIYHFRDGELRQTKDEVTDLKAKQKTLQAKLQYECFFVQGSFFLVSTLQRLQTYLRDTVLFLYLSKQQRVTNFSEAIPPVVYVCLRRNGFSECQAS